MQLHYSAFSIIPEWSEPLHAWSELAFRSRCRLYPAWSGFNRERNLSRLAPPATHTQTHTDACACPHHITTCMAASLPRLHSRSQRRGRHTHTRHTAIRRLARGLTLNSHQHILYLSL